MPETNKPTILGAIAGDVIGSVYEWNNIKHTAFDLFNHRCTFTDDTVLTVAVADAILNNTDFGTTIHEYGNHYPRRGYGGTFSQWLRSKNPEPYNSWGNGSAMRASSVGFAYDNIGTVLQKAKESAVCTHNHPDGIKGAQAVAAAVFMARRGKSKPEIKEFISGKLGYNLNFTLDSIRDGYTFDVSCQGSVPHAIRAFIESSDYENAIRLAISIGGDSDTIACITGGIAAAYYKNIPDDIVKFVRGRLDPELLEIVDEFDEKYG